MPNMDTLLDLLFIPVGTVIVSICGLAAVLRGRNHALAKRKLECPQALQDEAEKEPRR